jgi:hypothetical protein
MGLGPRSYTTGYGNTNESTFYVEHKNKDGIRFAVDCDSVDGGKEMLFLDGNNLGVYIRQNTDILGNLNISHNLNIDNLTITHNSISTNAHPHEIAFLDNTLKDISLVSTTNASIDTCIIEGGFINNTVIGNVTPNTGKFTTLISDNIGIGTTTQQTPLHIYKYVTDANTTNNTLITLETTTSNDANVSDFNPISIDFRMANRINYDDNGQLIHNSDQQNIARISAVIAPQGSNIHSNNPGDQKAEGSNALIFSTTDGDEADNPVIEPTERMRIGHSGNIGIGTQNPQCKLDVKDSYGFFHGSSNEINTVNTEPGVAIGCHDGLEGIIQLISNRNDGSFIDFKDSRRGNNTNNVYGNPDSQGYGNNDYFGRIRCHTKNGFRYEVKNNTQHTFSGGDVIIDDTKNLGIGTSSPSAPLHIYDTSNNDSNDTTNKTLLKLESFTDSDAAINKFNPISIDFELKQDSHQWSGFNSGHTISRIESCIRGEDATNERSTDLTFYTSYNNNLEESIRLSETINVYRDIKFTGNIAMNAGNKFHIGSNDDNDTLLNSTNADDSIFLIAGKHNTAPRQNTMFKIDGYDNETGGSHANPFKVVIYMDENDNIDYYFQNCNSSSNDGGKHYFRGIVVIENTLTVSGSNITSDDRLKVNEELLVNATSTLLKLRPQIYEKANQLVNPIQYRKEAGLIVQEIYYEIPELRYLIQIPDDATLIDDNKHRNFDDIQNDPDYSNWGSTKASLDYNSLITYLIRGFQEQNSRIVDLETENEKLKTKSIQQENEINILKNEIAQIKNILLSNNIS